MYWIVIAGAGITDGERSRVQSGTRLSFQAARVRWCDTRVLMDLRGHCVVAGCSHQSMCLCEEWFPREDMWMLGPSIWLTVLCHAIRLACSSEEEPARCKFTFRYEAGLKCERVYRPFPCKCSELEHGGFRVTSAHQHSRGIDHTTHTPTPSLIPLYACSTSSESRCVEECMTVLSRERARGGALSGVGLGTEQTEQDTTQR